MSVEQLVLTTQSIDLEIKEIGESVRLDIIGEEHEAICLDRNQARLLKIWLEEYLK